MKPKINRETVIGLSVLVLLLVILVGVAVRRWMRPNLPPEEIVAREEAKHEEERLDHRSKREAESLQKPDLLTPVATVNRDKLQALDDPGHWNAAAKERRKEARENSPPVGLIASDPPAISDSLESARHKREGERTSTAAPPELSPAANDDRYAAATEPSAEYRKKDVSSSPKHERGESMVVQVSDGESGDAAARSHDRYDRHDHAVQAGPVVRANDSIPPAPIVDQPPASPYGHAADLPTDARRHGEKARERELQGGMPADPETAGRHTEKARERELQRVGPPVDVVAPAATYAAEPPRTAPPYNYGPNSPPAGNMPNYSSLAASDAAPNYAATQGGYAPDRLPRPGGEFRDSMRAPNPLRDDGMYEIQPNDSYWTISERVYGSGAYFRALAEQNRGKAARPDRLPPGLLISTPPVARLEKDYPDLCPRPNRRDTVRNRSDSLRGYPGVSLAATAGGGRTYIVQEGDTLSSIARNELGKVSRWAEIYQLNREALGKDYDYLTPGLRLVLPIRDSQSGDRTTRRNDSGAPLTR